MTRRRKKRRAAAKLNAVKAVPAETMLAGQSIAEMPQAIELREVTPPHVAASVEAATILSPEEAFVLPVVIQPPALADAAAEDGADRAAAIAAAVSVTSLHPNHKIELIQELLSARDECQQPLTVRAVVHRLAAMVGEQRWRDG